MNGFQQIFNALKRVPEFKLLFADRVHRAFFNDGPNVFFQDRCIVGLRLGTTGSYDNLNPFTIKGNTPQGLRESHVHDVIITKESPNYRLE